jgi:hypothetical protein
MVRASALRSRVFIFAKTCSNGGANGAALMAAEVVHDDNVAWRENREENLLDISAEACAVNRSVDDAGRGEPVATQRRQESERPPFAERRFGDEAFASGASAMGARHVGFRPEPAPGLDPGVSSMKTSRLGSILA